MSQSLGIVLLAAGLAAVSLAAAAPVRSAEPPAGARHPMLAALAERGVTGSASMTGLWIGNVAGGLGRGGMINSLGTFAADVDLAKLSGGWRGAHAYASIAWIRGRSATWEYVGDALAVSNLDAFDSVRLYEAWLEQGMLADRVSVRAGVLAADGEFCASEGGGMFTNSGFGWSAGIAANVVNGGPIYYAPAPGARVVLRPADGWTLRAGAWDGDSFDSPGGDPLVNEHGTHLDISASQGRFLIAELQHAWNAADDATGPAGGWRLGAWRHTAGFADNRLDSGGLPVATSGAEPAMHRGNRGAYGLLDQRLWSEPGDRAQGLSAWGRLAVAPADRSAFSTVTDAGFHWTGLFRGREADVLGVGIVNAVVSPAAVLAAIEADGAGGPLPDFERVVELAYRWKLGDRWSVTADVQWVQHPGASGATPNALVPALRVTFE